METCTACKDRCQCKTLCKDISKKVWKGNRMMERNFDDHIVLYPLPNQTRFSEIADYKVNHFSTADAIPWSSGDTRLRKTAVFIERFFNKTPVHELAERFRVDDVTISSAYTTAISQLFKVVQALDAHKEGVKVSQLDRFTKEQKYFMLVFVFGFSINDVAKMFKYDRNLVGSKINRMAKKYGDLFAEQAKKDDTAIVDPAMSDAPTNDELRNVVDAYFKQGLPKSQAYSRIAERLFVLHGQHIGPNAIKKRCYRSRKMATQEDISIHAGQSVSEMLKEI